MSTDASDFAVGAVLEQVQDGARRAIAFESRKLRGAVLNWPTREKELFAVIHALRTWKQYLAGPIPFVIYTDHRPLHHLQKQTKAASPKIARWFELLALFDCEIVYRAGKDNPVADSLSRTEFVEDFCLSVETPDGVARETPLTVLSIEADASRVAEVIAKYRCDPMTSDIYRSLLGEIPCPPAIKAHCQHYRVHDKLLYYSPSFGGGPWRLVVPNCPTRTQLLDHAHSLPSSGHAAWEPTYARLSRDNFWRRMPLSVRRFVRRCLTCQRNKPSTQAQAGLYQPYINPQRCLDGSGK